MPAPAAFDVFDVLTRARGAREEFLSAVGRADDVDLALVTDLIRHGGRVSQTRAYHRELAELCAVLRAIDAHRQNRIDLAELHRGVTAHAARTDQFERFHDARVLLRTLDEVLAVREHAPERAVSAQVTYIHEELEEWLVGELGGAHAPTPLGNPDDRLRVTDGSERVAADELAAELLDGAAHHPVTGLAGAAWVRGWAAVPIAGDQLGDDDSAEVARLAAALRALDVERVLLVLRTAPIRWTLTGSIVRPGDGLRPSFAASTSDADMYALTSVSRAAALLTDANARFAVLEGVDHHVVAGPRAFVEHVLGRSVTDAFVAFRDHVEALVHDDVPPAHLAEAARVYGRLRRRAAQA